MSLTMFKKLRRGKFRKETTCVDIENQHVSTKDVIKTSETSTLDLYRDKKDGTSRQPVQRSHKPSTLGLHVLHQPAQDAPVDIIFVHGLGGDCRKTWSKNHDPALFWPELWLPLEPDIGKTRILSFGYNANFKAGSPRSISNVGDFAKELLFEMAFGTDESGGHLGIGKVPIIFIAHSMGGLVVKKAYVLGQNDEEFRNIIPSISAIMFMATPHRGTNLAEILNRILAVTFQSRKNFINDLNKSSLALEDINEQFRHIPSDLSLISFYETLATKIGPKKLMVLDKDSSILGYPKELSRGLNADHHDVVKYSSPSDSNYISVRNALKALVERFRSEGTNAVDNRNFEETRDIEKLLGISSGPEDDFTAFRRRWMPGTCGWLLEEPAIQLWFKQGSEPRIVWYSAPPASGKSILATHVINHLRDSGYLCQFFFFRFGDQTKRAVGTLLRSFAYQLSRDIPVFRRALIQLASNGFKFERADSSLVWQKIFEAILFEMELPRPIYWVIDALDECESPKALLDLLPTFSNARINVRIMIISRKTEPLFLAFEQLSEFIAVNSIEKNGQEHNALDIQTLVEKEIKHMRGGEEPKRRVKQRIIDRAAGNFLWVRLVLEEVLSCHSEAAIQQTLDEIPDDMNQLYQRMELSILKNSKESNRRLAKELLQWTICAHRSLTLNELSQVLRPEFPEFLDLRRTIQDVCGNFVLVDHNGNVAMVHQTARDYLIQTSNKDMSIDLKQGHTRLFLKSISRLLDPTIRFKLAQGQHALRSTDSFLFYAAISWIYHLRQAAAFSDEVLDMLVEFFKSQAVLAWIHALVLVDQFEILVKAAKVLSTFLRTRRRLNASKNRLPDLELIDQWVVDLVKVGKFSIHLLTDPPAIYTLVPPLCPDASILRKQFHRPKSAEVLVSGISNTAWNDNLARINIPSADRGWNIACVGQKIAVLGSAGDVFIWNSDNFADICTLRHQEPVTVMSFNNEGTKMVTYGLRSSKLWDIPSGQLLSVTPNPPDSKAMAITFSENDAKIVSGGNDKVIRYLHTDKFKSGWHELNPALLKESPIEGTIINSPVYMAFNGDATQVGVAYRGYPLSVWELNEGRCVRRCRRVRELRSDGLRQSNTWFGVDRFTFNPVSGHVIGIYRGGCIFKWHPLTDEIQEFQSAADEVAASPNGKLFATSNSNGTVKVWNFAYFSVIYQLSSSDLVTGLTFSPDCTRFYDIRGPSVNAWEPSSLIGFSETEESFSDSASEDSSPKSLAHASEALAVQYEAVSAIAACPTRSLYCFGNEEGIVQLLHAHTGETIELTRFLNFLNVSHLVWGEATYIAAADLGGDIVVKRLLSTDQDGLLGTEVKSLPSPKLNLEGYGIHQMLFNEDSSLLLIVSEDTCQIWGVEEGTMRSSAIIEQGTTRRWVKHPTQKHMFLGCGAQDIQVFQWDDLTKRTRLEFHEEYPRLDTQKPFDSNDGQELSIASLSLASNGRQEAVSSVKKAILTQNGKHLMVQIQEISAQGRFAKRTLIFNNCEFETSNTENGMLTYSHIPPDILARIEIPLNFLTGSRLVFLDQDLWLCTYRLGYIHDEGLKRHYFIPRDWVSKNSLEHCCMMDDETLLCPKDDRVAVIRSRLEVTNF